MKKKSKKSQRPKKTTRHGMRSDAGVWKVHRDDQAVVREVFLLAGEGHSMAGIAKRMRGSRLNGRPLSKHIVGQIIMQRNFVDDEGVAVIDEKPLRLGRLFMKARAVGWWRWPPSDLLTGILCQGAPGSKFRGENGKYVSRYNGHATSVPIVDADREVAAAMARILKRPELEGDLVAWSVLKGYAFLRATVTKIEFSIENGVNTYRICLRDAE